MIYLSWWVADNANPKPSILNLKLKFEPWYLIKFDRTCGIIDMIIVQVRCHIVNLIHFWQEVDCDPDI